MPFAYERIRLNPLTSNKNNKRSEWEPLIQPSLWIKKGKGWAIYKDNKGYILHAPHNIADEVKAKAHMCNKEHAINLFNPIIGFMMKRDLV